MRRVANTQVRVGSTLLLATLGAAAQPAAESELPTESFGIEGETAPHEPTDPESPTEAPAYATPPPAPSAVTATNDAPQTAITTLDDPTGEGPELTPKPVPTELPPLRYHDPHVDRVLLFPTAETQPEGTFVFSAYELAFWRFGYALADYLQFNFTTFAPIAVDEDVYAAGDLSAKWRVVSGRRGAVALTGAVAMMTAPMKGTIDNTPGTWIRAGGVGHACITPNCDTLLVAGVNSLVSGDDTSDIDVVTPYVGAVIHATRRFAFLIEPSMPITVENGRSTTLGLLNYGVRFHGDRIGFDIGFMRPLGEGANTFVFLPGVPFAAFSIRSYGRAMRRDGEKGGRRSATIRENAESASELHSH